MRKRGSEDCSGVSDLPEDVVNGVAQEAFPIVRRQKFGSQYCHELLKVHLAIACWTETTKKASDGHAKAPPGRS